MSNSLAHLLPLVGRTAMLPVAVTSRAGWSIPVRVVDVRIRFGIVDCMVAQPFVEKPSERDGSGIWVERHRLRFDEVASA